MNFKKELKVNIYLLKIDLTNLFLKKKIYFFLVHLMELIFLKLMKIILKVK